MRLMSSRQLLGGRARRALPKSERADSRGAVDAAT